MKTNMWLAGGSLFLSLSLAGSVGCAHRSNDNANASSSGICPTEVHHANVAVVEGERKIDVRIMTRPGGDDLAIQNRAEQIAQALLQVHPAQPPGSSQPVQHVAVSDVRVQSVPDGAVLTFLAQDEENLALLRDRIDDHVTRWRRGECPIMNDESVDDHEIKSWDTADR